MIPNSSQSHDYRSYKIERLFEQAINYLGPKSYLAQVIGSYRRSIMDTEATALLRLQLLLQGIHEAGGLKDDQFEHLAGIILTGQTEGWLL